MAPHTSHTWSVETEGVGGDGAGAGYPDVVAEEGFMAVSEYWACAP